MSFFLQRVRLRMLFRWLVGKKLNYIRLKECCRRFLSLSLSLFPSLFGARLPDVEKKKKKRFLIFFLPFSPRYPNEFSTRYAEPEFSTHYAKPRAPILWNIARLGYLQCCTFSGPPNNFHSSKHFALCIS